MKGRRFHKAKPYVIGIGASLGLLVFYMGIMALTADLYYAWIQFLQYRWWIVSLATGLGIQTGLFFTLRRRLKGVDRAAASSTLAATGGLSTASMVACCLHHISDIVPFLGFPLLAVTIQRYQTIFFSIGVVSNAFGIFMMLRMMARHGMVPRWRLLQLLTLRTSRRPSG